MNFNIGAMFVKVWHNKDNSETSLKFILPVGNQFMLMFKFGINTSTDYAPINVHVMVYNRESDEAVEEALLS